MSESPASTLLRERSAAKQLFFGDILEENLFPYPAMRERDREMLGMMLDSIDDFLAAHRDGLKQWDEHGEQPEAFIQGTADAIRPKN